MSRAWVLGPAIAGLVILVGLCYGPAILGKQFAFRDAAHYYYPLYQRVEAEWDAGRWPLWEPEENGGMPLLGNPTAAVLYPGKVIYRALPYPLAARVYVIAHTLLAFAGAVALGRGLGIGATGSLIAGTAHAFGGPVLFQYCNIIYLVGAAWLPWGFLAVDAWLRKGRRWALPALGATLAMQVLGGEPQSAYLVGLCSGGYALLIGRGERAARPPSAWRRVLVGCAVVAGLAAWVGATLWLAWYLPLIRPKRANPPVPTFAWTPWVQPVALGSWAVATAWLLIRWRAGRPDASRLGRRLTGLAVAASLGGMLAGAQLLPVLEFAGRTGRAADEGTHDIYPFSLEPYRVAELLFPNFFGTLDRGNRLWLNLLPPMDNHKIWINSLYMGSAVLALALVGLGGRGAPAWRRWMVAIAGLSLVASIGEFASPIWAARWFPGMARLIGPHDPSLSGAIRLDGFLRDGDGSLYHLLSVTVPGFQQFRYPSKLLSLTTLALAVLAGHGWDRVRDGARRAAWGWSIGLLVVALGTAAGALVARPAILRGFGKIDLSTLFGPFDPPGTFREILGSTLHCALALVGLLGVLALVRRRPAAAGFALVLLVAVDIGWANRRIVAVTDQANFEGVPKVIGIIDEAEKAAPTGGPFRVHRMPTWDPHAWRTAGSPDRYSDLVRWERATIQPKYGIPLGVEYTLTRGVAELYDYEWFFSGWTVAVSREIAKRLGMNDPTERPVYYPRRGFDMWNTRYFVVPGITKATNPDRGIGSFLFDIETIYPPPGGFEGPGGEKRHEEQLLNEDVQVFRNRHAMPRAWVVHELKFISPIEGLRRWNRSEPMEEMLYAADPLWSDPDRHLYDLHRTAWVETDDPNAFAHFHPRGMPGANESVTVRYPSPQRAELDVALERPGIVVLADAFYPGWTLTIDGKPAPILRANRMMRGAAVESGVHKLVYEFRPRSFAVGRVVTLAGLGGLLGFGFWSRRRPGGVV